MYNLHAHTLLSDGALLPSEVAMRYLALGYKGLAITDHADCSNIEGYIKSVLAFTRRWPKDSKIKVLPGIEFTHLPLGQFKGLAKYARSKGIQVIIAHGETVMEPVVKGTNSAALEADIDILAHPGHISEKDVLLAKKRGIFLEITSRAGHKETNREVVQVALRLGAKLILNNDSHAPEDIISPKELIKVGLAAGLTLSQIEEIKKGSELFFKRR